MANLKIMIDAGHGVNTPGKRCLKSLDPKETREWKLNNKDANHLMTLLSGYECEVARADDVTGAKDIPLEDRVAKANNWKADVYISLHQNAGIYGKRIGYKGKLAGGTVVFYCGSSEKNRATSLYNEIVANTGLVGDRAQKVIDNNFYVIRYTSMPAFLIENGFMDSPTDVPIILSEEHSRKTAEGIVNFLVKEFGLKRKENVKENKYKVGDCVTFTSCYKNATDVIGKHMLAKSMPKNFGVVTKITSARNPYELDYGYCWVNDGDISGKKQLKNYIYAGVDYKLVFDPVYYYNSYADLRKSVGKNEDRLLKHFVQYGMKEQRQACSWFNVAAYKNNYADLQKAFGSDMPKYYRHYIQYGYKENRRGY